MRVGDVHRRRPGAGVPALGVRTVGRGHVLIRSHYTCTDGSGTFDALKHLQLTFTETGFTGVGPMQILGGTGRYAGIVGHGIGVGSTDFETGIGGGTTTGFVQQ